MSDEVKSEVEDEVVDIFQKVKKGEPDPMSDMVEDESVLKNENEDDATAAATVVPEKFKGKSLDDVIDMYGNLEQAFGRRSSEVGELRKLTDEILKGTATPEKDTKPATIDSDALLENPTEALNQAIASHPVLQKLTETLVNNEIATSKRDFEAKHGDAQKVQGIPGLADWIMANPERLRRWNTADQAYDYGTADELLSTFKEIQAAKGSQSQEATADAARAALSAPRSGSAGSAGDATGKVKTRKVFKRAQLMRLRKEDPDRYDKMQNEILLAYREGRVK